MGAVNGGASMIVSIIAAMDKKRGIGVDNKLPWRLSADLKRFRELTMGHHIIVGRKTFESIGRPLPGRRMIIVTHNLSYAAEGGDVAHTVEDAIELARARGETEVFVCGGAEIYAQAITLAQARRPSALKLRRVILCPSKTYIFCRTASGSCVADDRSNQGGESCQTIPDFAVRPGARNSHSRCCSRS